MSCRPRSARPVIAMLLAAGVATALAGCAGDGGSDATRLSDLGDKKEASMLKVADASRAAGDCVAAIRFYRLVKDSDDKHRDAANAHLGAADCELSMNALPDAEHDYQEAMKLLPEDPAPLVGLGRVSLIQHKPGEAANYLDRAIKKGADAAYIWNDKGVADDQLRRHKDAQQAYRAGLAKFPGDRALRNNLALSLAMTRDFAEAETLLRGLADEPGTTSRLRENLALVLGLDGKTDEARQVAQGDLDGAALDNNSRFYEYARALLTGESTPVPSAAAALPDARAVAETAIAPRARVAAAPVPPPVLVKDRPLAGLRTAEPSPIAHPRPSVAAAELAAPPAAPSKQTAALPPPASDPPKAAVAAPTRMVAPGGGALKNQPAAVAAQPVASSE